MVAEGLATSPPAVMRKVEEIRNELGGVAKISGPHVEEAAWLLPVGYWKLGEQGDKL